MSGREEEGEEAGGSTAGAVDQTGRRGAGAPGRRCGRAVPQAGRSQVPGHPPPTHTRLPSREGRGLPGIWPPAPKGGSACCAHSGAAPEPWSPRAACFPPWWSWATPSPWPRCGTGAGGAGGCRTCKVSASGSYHLDRVGAAVQGQEGEGTGKFSGGREAALTPPRLQPGRAKEALLDHPSPALEPPPPNSSAPTCPGWGSRVREPLNPSPTRGKRAGSSVQGPHTVERGAPLPSLVLHSFARKASALLPRTEERAAGRCRAGAGLPSWGRSWDRLLPRTEVGLGLSTLGRAEDCHGAGSQAASLPHRLLKVTRSGCPPAAARDRPAGMGWGLPPPVNGAGAGIGLGA